MVLKHLLTCWVKTNSFQTAFNSIRYMDDLTER
ncbi:hypothetical protein SAMN05444008_110169 [Cnuella takakiae]|uniref:Uncharacterized protein n=1 Tax=Cnuella takakiae TaxID=1302690 RepID=A0A1M5DC91_9BACT|nr:hypothetical protein SAMN05444008_110169 [Cnuella takakiae]